ncbi:MAG: ABC transporter permease [Clostridia bacterium]|nr:ABC transporter permease [Clostridia bacterium]
MDKFLAIIFSVSFGYAVLRVTTPLIFASMGALISDKAGVINIGLEGIMLIAALTGVVASAGTQSALIGLLAAVLAGALSGALMAYASLNLKTNIILSGVAINLIGSGGTVFALYLIAQDKGISTSLKSLVLPKIEIPIISQIPVVSDIFSGHNVLTYVALLSVLLVYILVFKTPLGLQIRAVGENENAADSVGVSVIKIKYIALILSGAFAGFGGAYMSMGYVSWFSKNMTVGRGFIALAAEAMGGSNPVGTAVACFVFGAAEALSNSLQSLRVPTEFVQMIPYIVTVLGLVIYSSSKQSQIKKYLKNRGK